MRNFVEAALAIAILIIGGSTAMLATGIMPQPIEAHARSVAGAIGMAGLVSENTPGEDARQRGGFGRHSDIAITAAPVRIKPFTDRVRAIGTGRALRSVTVATSVSGLVEEVHFRSNSTVVAGDPLITLDRDAQAIALESARAEHAQANAVNDRYQASGKRSSTFSLAQIEEIETTLAVAEATLKQAQFEYDRRVIRAPFSGRVGLVDVAIGQHLSVGAEIVRLDDTSALEVEFLVPEAKTASIALGTPIRAMGLSLPGRIFEGEVVATDSYIDPATRTLRVRARVPNPEQTLTPGATFSIEVPVDGTAMPVVPALAVQWSRDGAYVWSIQKDGVERVPVVISKRDGDSVFVDATLDDGALIAVEGAQKLNANSTVIVQATPRLDGPLTVEVPALRQQALTANASTMQVTQ